MSKYKYRQVSEGLLGPEFYGDLVYKFTNFIGRGRLSFRFGKIVDILNVVQQSACLDSNPIMIDNYAALFNIARQTRCPRISIVGQLTESVSPRFWFIMVAIMIYLFVLYDTLTS